MLGTRDSVMNTKAIFFAAALGTVATLKRDPSTMAIRTVGYASHVLTEVIDAARQAGVDEVLARSAFTARLPEILASATTQK